MSASARAPRVSATIRRARRGVVVVGERAPAPAPRLDQHLEAELDEACRRSRAWRRRGARRRGTLVEQPSFIESVSFRVPRPLNTRPQVGMRVNYTFPGPGGARSSAANQAWAGTGARRTRNSRCRISRFSAHLQRDGGDRQVPDPAQLEPGQRATAGTPGSRPATMRMNELTSDGIVLPIAWNMLERDEDHARSDEVPGRRCAGTRRRPRSPPGPWRTRRSCAAGAMCAQQREDHHRRPPPSAPPIRNVARTRSGRRAPKFCPATGPTANPSATTGMKPACITRRPMPKPACAAAPNGRVTDVDDDQVDAHQRELRARPAARSPACAPHSASSRPPVARARSCR